MPSSVLQGKIEGEGRGSNVGRRTSSGGAVPVSRILEVRVVLEGGVTENHRGLGRAANWEGVSNDRPLRTRSHGGCDWPAHTAGFLSPGCPSLTLLHHPSTPALTWGSPARTRTFPRSCSSPTRWNQSGRERDRAG